MKKYLLLTLSTLVVSASVFAQSDADEAMPQTSETILEVSETMPQTSEWLINKTKSSIILNVLDNFTPLTWMVGEPSGIIHFDAYNLEGSYLSFGFPISKIRSGSGRKRRSEIKKLFMSNGEAASREPKSIPERVKLLFTKNNTEIAFYSTKIEPKKDKNKSGQARYLTVTGDLTVGNETISNVKMDGTIIGLTVDPENNKGFVCTINFSFKFKLSDYDIIPTGSLERLSDEVNISIALEIKRGMR